MPTLILGMSQIVCKYGMVKFVGMDKATLTCRKHILLSANSRVILSLTDHDIAIARFSFHIATPVLLVEHLQHSSWCAPQF